MSDEGNDVSVSEANATARTELVKRYSAARLDRPVCRCLAFQRGLSFGGIMTTEPQTDPTAELTLARADLKSADAHLLELEATMPPPVDLGAVQAKLDALQVAYEAKQAEVKQQSAERQAFRKESWAWRKLAGVPQTLTPLSPTEVASKKL